MKLSLGVPLTDAESPLATRLAQLTLARLVFLSVLLAIIGRWHLREIHLRDYSVQVALMALAVGFALAAGYAIVLRTGRHLRGLAIAQVLFDQVTWTVLVYVSGGANSGATSLYGLTALTGAVFGGLPAAAFAAGIGYLLYATLCTLMVLGIVPVPPDQPDVAYATSVEQVVYPLGLNLLVLLVVALLASYLAERLRVAGGAIEEANVRARRAERLAYLGRVAAGLAHEIRNPLSSISASAELLRDAPGLGQEDRKLCEIIQREATRLNDLVGDMLDLAKPRKPELAPTDVAAVARDVVTLASRLGRAGRDVQIVYEGPQPSDAPVVVEADAGQLRQVLWNLVRNGVQATAPGNQVTVRVSEGAQGVQFEVIDQGVGIPADSAEQVFEAFYTTRSQGVGIGLAVVKRIVDDHGWSIRVHSQPGEGSCFRVLTRQGSLKPQPTTSALQEPA